MKVSAKVLCAVGVLSLCVGEVMATNIKSVGIKAQKRDFCLYKPLSDLQVIDSLSKEERDYFENKTWDKTKTLEENQKNLVNQFIENCVDFSFRKIDNISNEVEQGKLDSGNLILFRPDGNAKGLFVDFCEHVKTTYGYTIPQDLHDAIMTWSVSPKDCIDDDCKKKFLNSIKAIAKDSVGCEMLRHSIAKSVVNELPKAAFIPVNKEAIYESAGLLANVLYMDAISFLEYFKNGRENKDTKKRKLILFAPELFTEKSETYAIKSQTITNKKKKKVKKLVREKKPLPVDVSLFHEMIHYYRKDMRKGVTSSSVIQKRFGAKYNNYPDLISELYGNNEEYRTVYGLTDKELDPINESSYFVHKHGYIRSAYTAPENEDRIREEMGVEEIIDRNIGEYYLLPESPITFPKFGVGQYECSDLDLHTGEKLNQNPQSKEDKGKNRQ